MVTGTYCFFLIYRNKYFAWGAFELCHDFRNLVLGKLKLGFGTFDGATHIAVYLCIHANFGFNFGFGSLAKFPETC